MANKNKVLPKKSPREFIAEILHAAADKLVPKPSITGNSRWDDDPEFNGTYMVDFRPDRFGSPVVSYGPKKKQVATKKQAVTPKQVMHELMEMPTNITLEGLDGKIKILEEKKELIQQKYAQEHVDFLLNALKNRKRYDEHCNAVKSTYRTYFGQLLGATHDEKIKQLIENHKKEVTLMMNPADIFVPEFPDEAVTIMSSYAKVVKELTGKLPRFYVIAREQDFRKMDKKRDPIVLAQSPFGMYYYVLGAWDAEMQYLPEL